MKELCEKNPRASFGFIGSCMESESTYMTKRFRVYSVMMATYFDEDVFEHFIMMDKSAYLLIRKKELELYPGFPEELTLKFNQMYDYFD